jgi:hypothetical protein
MKIENKRLFLTQEELKEIIRNNPDKSDENNRIENILISIIDRKRVSSNKIYNWILSKIKYVTNVNRSYKDIRKKFNDFCIVNNIY